MQIFMLLICWIGSGPCLSRWVCSRVFSMYAAEGSTREFFKKQKLCGPLYWASPSSWFPQSFWFPWSSCFRSTDEKAGVFVTLFCDKLLQLCQYLGVSEQETRRKKQWGSPSPLRSRGFIEQRGRFTFLSFGSWRFVLPMSVITTRGMLGGWDTKEQAKWRRGGCFHISSGCWVFAFLFLKLELRGPSGLRLPHCPLLVHCAQAGRY